MGARDKWEQGTGSAIYDLKRDKRGSKEGEQGGIIKGQAYKIFRGGARRGSKGELLRDRLIKFLEGEQGGGARGNY